MYSLPGEKLISATSFKKWFGVGRAGATAAIADVVEGAVVAASVAVVACSCTRLTAAVFGAFFVGAILFIVCLEDGLLIFFCFLWFVMVLLRLLQKKELYI